jgi:hypothetical protein
LAGTAKVVGIAVTTYNGAMALVESGQCFLECLKEGYSFERKRDWYSALRGADVLIRDGNICMFKELVCKAPCKLDPAFQWGVCQRLGEIAVNPLWGAETRRDAIRFLGEIYQNDAEWGQQPSVKQWVLNILMQMTTPSETGLQRMWIV